MLKKIKDLCKQERITLSELEKTLGFGNGTIQKWSTSKPSFDKVLTVAKYFNITVDDLTNETECMSKEVRCLSKDIMSLNNQQVALVMVYVSLIKNGQVN